jgi:hypothetical protein
MSFSTAISDGTLQGALDGNANGDWLELVVRTLLGSNKGYLVGSFVGN